MCAPLAPLEIPSCVFRGEPRAWVDEERGRDPNRAGAPRAVTPEALEVRCRNQRRDAISCIPMTSSSMVSRVIFDVPSELMYSLTKSESSGSSLSSFMNRSMM